jgi:hypothetical protein
MLVRNLVALLLLGSGAGSLACTWVKLTPEGERVELLEEGVHTCEHVGQTRVQTTPRVWIFARRDRKIDEEQTALARNEAARMGGNAVVPLESPGADGERLFGVYRCPR